MVNWNKIAGIYNIVFFSFFSALCIYILNVVHEDPQNFFGGLLLALVKFLIFILLIFSLFMIYGGYKQINDIKWAKVLALVLFTIIGYITLSVCFLPFNVPGISFVAITPFIPLAILSIIGFVFNLKSRNIKT